MFTDGPSLSRLPYETALSYDDGKYVTITTAFVRNLKAASHELEVLQYAGCTHMFAGQKTWNQYETIFEERGVHVCSTNTLSSNLFANRLTFYTNLFPFASHLTPYIHISGTPGIAVYEVEKAV